MLADDQNAAEPSSKDNSVGSEQLASPPSPKVFRTSSSKRLSGRLPDRPSPSLKSISSIESISSGSTIEPTQIGYADRKHKFTRSRRHHDQASRVLAQVVDWLQSEKARRKDRTSRGHGAHAKLKHAANAVAILTGHAKHDDSENQQPHRSSKDSDLSETNLALEQLERILSEHMTLDSDAENTFSDSKRGFSSRRKRSLRKSSVDSYRRGSAATPSDSEHPDNELFVPSAEVILDNTKTLAFSLKASSSTLSLQSTSKRIARDKEHWRQFKEEIVTLTHTLRIPGWRRFPIAQGEGIDVERLSGAMTNAVYVVSPPPDAIQQYVVNKDQQQSLPTQKRLPKLLLRIYGPQCDHLIDREGELQILRRLARKKIGPRLLGTFTNGRFEEFFNARPLTAQELRQPETSIRIAKRMRELHDGIDLLNEEKDGGPFVWKRWDKSIQRCEEVALWLDEQVYRYRESPVKGKAHDWKAYGYVCGVEWPFFRLTVDRYRAWLVEQYGGSKALMRKLVFAHNDTQYGNLLRLQPSGESPLLLPANEHKQLIVIDFEYASANVPGLEFANHFTEWCYNYEDSAKPYGLAENKYPNPGEQDRFLKAYLLHRPLTQSPFFSAKQASSPALSATGHQGGSSSISSFMLDSRAPPVSGGYAAEEKAREAEIEADMKQLRHETRLWRVANSAQWVAWGIVQAKIKGLEEILESRRSGSKQMNSGAIGTSGRPHRISDTPDSPVSRRQSHPKGHPSLASDPLQPDIALLAKAAHDKRPEFMDKTSTSDGGDIPRRIIQNDGKQDQQNSAAEEDEEDDDDDDDDDDEFDCLAYAQERAWLFWGDILQQGIVSRDELPKELLARIKVVKY